MRRFEINRLIRMRVLDVTGEQEMMMRIVDIFIWVMAHVYAQPIASLLGSLIFVQQIDFIRPSTIKHSAQAVLTALNVQAGTLTRTLREIPLFYISLLREQLILLFADLLSPYCCGLFLIVLSFSPFTLMAGRLTSACLAIVLPLELLQ